MLHGTKPTRAAGKRRISGTCAPEQEPKRSRLNDNLICGECMSVDRLPLNYNQLNGNCSKQWAVVNENSDNLSQIWIRCIENCHSKTLQQLLLDHGKLVSIKQFEGHAIAFIAFEDCEIKSRAQRFLSSITNSIETVLECNVEVKMGPQAELIDGELTSEAGPKVRRVESDVLGFSPNSDRLKGIVNSSRRSFDHPDEGKKELEKYKNTPCADERMHSVSVTLNSGIPKVRGLEVPTQASKESINGEQRLESAWLQVSEKHTPDLTNQAKHGHQALSQVVENQYQRKSSMSLVVPSSLADEDLAHEIQALKIVESYGSRKHQSGRSENGFSISPSKLHRKDDMVDCDNESVCSEPGRPGCRGLFPCWKAQKPKGKKAKRQVRVKSS